MITYLAANWEDLLTIYVVGLFVWCAFMSYHRLACDFDYFISAVIWPFMLIHVVFVKLSYIIKGDARRGGR